MTSARTVRQRQARRRRPKAAAKRKQRVPPQPKVGERPHILLLGQSALSKRLCRVLTELGVPNRRVDNPEDVEVAINRCTRGVVIVPPIPSFSVLAYARRCRERSVKVATFVVMNGPMPIRTSRALYADGISAAFEWPADADAVKRTMLRLTSPEPLRWGRKRTASEIALEETARAHLEADATPFGAQLGVEACGRVILLKGTVDALWKLELARQVVAEVNGVDDVIADGVEVQGIQEDDRKVARAVRTVLKHASSVDGSTLAVAVRSGEVTLAGSVVDRQEARRAMELVRQVRGVRRIQDYLVVSKTAKHRDHSLARRVRTAVTSRYPRLPVDLSVFGNVAVMSGRVPSARYRDQVRELVEKEAGVERVVDKLQVRSRSR
jgi:osmotically-inducible protein OsmY